MGSYTKTTWVNGQAPAINATNLQKVEDALKVAYDAVGGNEGTGVPYLAGVRFPAMQVPSSGANTLDDYEEGYFTATLTPGTSGTVTISASFNECSYTRIGRKVHIQGALIIDSVSSPVGTFLTMNLPFTILDLTEISGRFGSSVTYLKSAYSLIPAVAEAEAIATIKFIIDCSTVAAADRFYFSFSYHAV